MKISSGGAAAHDDGTMTFLMDADRPNASEGNGGTGYLHRLYAESLEEFGSPCFLPASGGWILERRIPGTPYHDAMGCYPLFTCHDWSRLHIDLSIGSHLLDIRTPIRMAKE